MSRKNNQKKPLLSGDAKFALIVVAFSLLLLAAIIYFGKSEKVEIVEEPVDISTENQVTVGSEDAPVEVVQFFDFQCPHCQDWDQQVFPGLNEKYIETGKIKYTLINFPFLGKASDNSALLFETINGIAGPEKAIAFKSDVFANVKSLGEEGKKAFYDKNLLESAEKILTADEFVRVEESYKDKEFSPAIDIDNNIAKSANVLGTPALYINNVYIQDGTNPDVLFAEIDKALEDK